MAGKGKACSVQWVQELSYPHAAHITHTRIEFTVGHTQEKSASNLHISFQLVLCALSV